MVKSVLLKFNCFLQRKQTTPPENLTKLKTTMNSIYAESTQKDKFLEALKGTLVTVVRDLALFYHTKENGSVSALRRSIEDVMKNLCEENGGFQVLCFLE